MGLTQTKTYIRGGGTHRSVPPPMHSKVKFFSSTKRLSSQSSVEKVYNSEPKVNSAPKKIDWDFHEVNEENYDTIKYEIRKLANRNKIDLSMM